MTMIYQLISLILHIYTLSYCILLLEKSILIMIMNYIFDIGSIQVDNENTKLTTENNKCYGMYNVRSSRVGLNCTTKFVLVQHCRDSKVLNELSSRT